MGQLTHVHMSIPVEADGYIDLGNGDVVKAEVFAEALRKSKTVEPCAVSEGHQEIQWIQHVDEAMALAINGSPEAQAEAMKGMLAGLCLQAVDRKRVDP